MELDILFEDIAAFTQAGGLRLRGYQQRVARAVIESVFRGQGLTFTILFPRQSGKNELQAQIEAYLLAILAYRGAEMVKISPTWKPQAQNAMARLERVLEANLLTRGRWQKENGYIYRIGLARITFLSGAPEANIVGATASTLLEVDEAQDVQIDKYDKEIAPMAASTNATRALWGTAWTATTLLARELRAGQAAERAGGARRVFVLTADAVAAEAPAYGQFVAGQVARLGRQHPMVKSQFYSEELDGVTGMFPAERLARMFPPASGPAAPGSPYALLIDVAGADAGYGATGSGGATGVGGAGGVDGETALANPGRDATATTVVQVDLGGLADPLRRAPVYRPVERRQWLGMDQASLFDEILALAARWQARCLVVDATGVGAGLAAFLERAVPGRVRPFLFNQASKSRLGWDFLALADGGRWQEGHGPDPLREVFRRQLVYCHCEVLPGPNRWLRWGVPDGARDPASGELVRDDLLISAALCCVLDQEAWAGSPGGALHMVRAKDPLSEMRGF